MVFIFRFSYLSSKIPFSKNEKYFKCQRDLLKFLQSKQSSTLCQEQNSGTKHLNEGLELPGESGVYPERVSRAAVFGLWHLSTVSVGLFLKVSSQLFHNSGTPPQKNDPQHAAHH